MKLTTVLLLLVAASVALAGPQRPLRRFTPRRGQEAAQVDAETAAAAEADPVEAEEPAQPRFRIAGRPSGSSFTPKRSSSPAPEPAQDAAAIIAAVAAPTPATRTPVSASPSRPRTRGSRTFVQSLKQSNIPIEASQLEKLEKSKQSLQRISSRPSSRPSTRVSTSAAPALRTPSRPSSVRAPIEKSSAATNKADQENVASKASPPASVSKPSGSDQESRRQRLLAIKKRPRAGAPSATPSVEKKNMPEEEPEQASSTPIETPKLNAMDKKDDSMPEKSTAPKLDEEVSETLDASIKSEAEQGGEAMKKQMATKETAAEEKMPKDAEPSAQSAVTPQPETSTTTVAPTAPRRINTLTRLRASRPVSGSGTGSARPRTSAPAAATPESPATDVQPRLSSRRGGRGNSRGGAALATSARVSRPSSRVPTSRVSRTGDEEAEPTQPEAPAAGTTGRLEARRRG